MVIAENGGLSLSPRPLTALSATLIAALTVVAFAAERATPRPGQSSADPRSFSIEVPVDRGDPALGTALIKAELGAPLDLAKPVLFVIADAQQFYVREGAVPALQRERFGDAFNVVGIIGRGSNAAFIEASLGADGTTDWERAWRIFSAKEWIEDIEAVRRALLGPDGQILLYGQSGGALLVHEYLARYGEHAARAATSAPVNPFLVGELGLEEDRFWDEVREHDPELPSLLRQALLRFPGEREEILMTLQRQNFFVASGDLPDARADLIRALARGDSEAYARARRDYQVDIIREYLASPRGIPVRVRHFEFVAPSASLDLLDEEGISPDIENQRNIAAPLLDLWNEGRIPTPTWDRAALCGLDAEVLVIAGARDHTVDYRSAIALAFSYPSGTLFLADDDHQFHRLRGAGLHDRLVRAFLEHGGESGEFRSVVRAAEHYRLRGR